MAIFISSDTHGTKDVGKLVNYFNTRHDVTKGDYLILCGDVAVCGFRSDEERATIETLRSLPVTVLFCDGNHENFDKLNAYPEEEWNGGVVHWIYDDLIHLMRGQVYEIDNQTFYVFGGAYSLDRGQRVEELTWFEEEIPTAEELKEGWNNLEKVDYTVDYVITHTAPFEVLSAVGYGGTDDEEFTRELQRMADTIDFEHWYFGHLHEDITEDEFTCVWEEIIEL